MANIRIDDLKNKWRKDSPDEPPCASCGKIIKNEVPVRLFRNDNTEELDLCPKCFEERAKS